MKQLALVARNVMHGEYSAKYDRSKAAIAPMVEVIIATAEQKQTPTGNVDEFDNFRFWTTPAGLRDLATNLNEWADDAEADLKKLFKQEPANAS